MLSPLDRGLVYPGPARNRLLAVFDGFACSRTCTAAKNRSCRSTDGCANRTRCYQSDARANEGSRTRTSGHASDVLTNVAGTIRIIFSAKAVENLDDRFGIRHVMNGNESLSFPDSFIVVAGLRLIETPLLQIGRVDLVGGFFYRVV